MTARRRTWWLGVLLGAAFVVARLVPFLGAHIGRGLDTFDYRAASHLPIFSREFLGGPRPFGYPLYLKAVAHNEHVAAAGQLVLDTAAWLVLAVMAARATRDRRLAGVAFVAVLGVGVAFEPIQWDRIISSEALSTAFAVGLLAALLWIRERWTGPRLALIGVLAFLATIVRDSNGTFFGVVAVVLALGVLLRWVPVRVLGLCAVLLAVAAAGSVSASMGKRWEGPVKDVITIRLLESPERLASLQHSGLPLSPAQIEEIKGNCVSPKHLFPCVYLVDPAFYDWIKVHGRPAYVHVLLKTPATTAWEPLAHLRDSVGTRVRTEVGTGSGEHAPVSQVFEAVFFARNPVVLVVWSCLVLAAAAWVLARRRRLGILAIAVALVALTYPHLWLVWDGGALEVSRHSLLASIQLRLGLWLGTVWVLDALLAPRAAPARDRPDRAPPNLRSGRGCRERAGLVRVVGSARTRAATRSRVVPVRRVDHRVVRRRSVRRGGRADRRRIPPGDRSGRGRGVGRGRGHRRDRVRGAARSAACRAPPGAHAAADTRGTRTASDGLAGVALARGLALPTVWIVDDDAPNAFVIGRPERAHAVFTTAALRLPGDELEALCAFELSALTNHTFSLCTAAIDVVLVAEMCTRVLWALGVFVFASAIVGVPAEAVAVVLLSLAALIAVTRLALVVADRALPHLLDDADGLIDLEAIGCTGQPQAYARLLRRVRADGDRVATNWTIAHLWFDRDEDESRRPPPRPGLMRAVFVMPMQIDPPVLAQRCERSSVASMRPRATRADRLASEFVAPPSHPRKDG